MKKKSWTIDASDSIAIKFFYAALVCVTGAMAFQRARGLTRER